MSDQDEQETGVEAMDADEAAKSTVAGGEQDVTPATAPGFNPDTPRATSPPPPESQSGTPTLADENTTGTVHTESGTVDQPEAADDEPEPEDDEPEPEDDEPEPEDDDE